MLKQKAIKPANAHTFAKQAEILSARKFIETLFLGQGRSVGIEILVKEGTTISEVHCVTQEAAQGHS
jgi:hypothetical protein